MFILYIDIIQCIAAQSDREMLDVQQNRAIASLKSTIIPLLTVVTLVYAVETSVLKAPFGVGTEGGNIIGITNRLRTVSVSLATSIFSVVELVPIALAVGSAIAAQALASLSSSYLASVTRALSSALTGSQYIASSRNSYVVVRPSVSIRAAS